MTGVPSASAVWLPAFVRSPHVHARLLSIDTSAARAFPGVLGVYTGADLAAEVNLEATLRRITETSARTLGVARVGIWRYAAERRAIHSDAMQKGITMKKIERQPKASTSRPPMLGPSAGASAGAGHHARPCAHTGWLAPSR